MNRPGPVHDIHERMQRLGYELQGGTWTKVRNPLPSALVRIVIDLRALAKAEPENAAILERLANRYLNGEHCT